jgi:UDP-glucose 4-epimerase
MIKNKRIFITGGGGFIGSHLANSLSIDNEVIVYDDFHRGQNDSRKDSLNPKIQQITGSVLDIAKLRSELSAVNVVVHCAAIVGINTVGNHPIQTLDVNIKGSANVLEAASELSSIEQVVCFSTSEIYGEYALSKLSEEFYARAFFVEKGLPITILRPFNVFGPGQIGDGAVKSFIQRALKNETIEIVGDGLQIRSWCFVDDFIHATNLALNEKRSIGETFNIGNPGNTVTIDFLAKTVVRLLNSSSRVEYINAAQADVYVRIPKISKAQQILGFEPVVGLEEGILKTAMQMN